MEQRDVLHVRSCVVKALRDANYSFPFIGHVINCKASECECYYEDFQNGTWDENFNRQDVVTNLKNLIEKSN